MAPSRQQLATWVVEAWDKIPEEMVRKSWTACGYPSEEELSFSDRGQIVPWTEDAVRAMVKQYCGQEGLDHLEDEENGNEDALESVRILECVRASTQGGEHVRTAIVGLCTRTRSKVKTVLYHKSYACVRAAFDHAATAQ